MVIPLTTVVSAAQNWQGRVRTLSNAVVPDPMFEIAVFVREFCPFL